jgi:hypothetical protein
MFLHCASNADYLVNAKKSLAENAASPFVVGKALSLGAIPATD